MSRQPLNQGGSVPFATARHNEYFVPRDGIDREVISADICRYLGNDALVRPGHYEDPQRGQVVHGYYITAYRNLTTAMIDDLKADSLRWDKERRAQTARSNTSGGQYRMSETHQSRQHYGPSESDGYPRYPGSGSGGFIGAAAGFDRQQQPPQQQHPGNGGGYGYQQQPPSQPLQQNPGYPGGFPQGAQGMDRGFAQNQDNQSPYVLTGANMSIPRDYPPNDAYNSNRMPQSAPPQQPIYASSGPPQPGYPAATYPYPGQMSSPAGGQSYQNMHPQDGYGRAGQGSQQPQGYPAQGQQYGETPNSRTSVPPPSVPTPSSGATKRRSDQDDDRHTPTDRHSRPPPRR